MIALIFCGDLKYCPYIKRYIERLELKNKKYQVYFWNRGGFDLNLSSNYVYFNSSSDLNKGKIGKAIDFFKFRKWLLNRLKEDNPDGVIVLSTLSGVILGKHLYKGKRSYVFDIRDYSYEHIWPFFRVEKKIIKKSTFTAISSPGFKSFLPEHNYVIAHNFNRNDIIPGKRIINPGHRIQFVWNGVVRYFEFQKQYIDSLKNDDRFEIVFHGDGPELELYKGYCTKNNIRNIRFTGSYENSQKEALLENACILNNCYGYVHNAGNKLKYAVSNRFYDGIIYHIPQLVEPDGYKTEWALKSGLGINLYPGKGFANRLYDYYVSLDREKFDEACEVALKKVLCDDDNYILAIDQFI